MNKNLREHSHECPLRDGALQGTCDCSARLVEEQAPPVPNERKPVWELVMADMAARDAVGRERYGTPLQSFNGRDALVDAYQEALDQVVYLRQAIEERGGPRPTEPGELWVDGAGRTWTFTRADEDHPTCTVPCFIFKDAGDLCVVAKRSFDWTGPIRASREAMATELRRLKARENELLADNTAKLMELRAVDRKRMVREFHVIAKQAAPPRPVIPSDDVVRFRARLICEEGVIEILEALFGEYRPEPWRLRKLKEDIAFFIDNAPVVVDMPSFVDATVDADYVVEGTRIAFGVDSTPVWAEVQRANMAKLDGPMRPDGKILKPPGWVAPDILGRLREQGWKGE